MPSFSSSAPKRSSSSSYLSSQQKKQKMSLTQTYFLAHTARAKLSKEASRGDHNLRRLVGHANLLDGLMIDLVEAERSQEALFNASTRQSQYESATQSSRQPTITEDYEEDDESDSDYEEEAEIYQATRQTIVSASEISQEDDEDQAADDEEDYEHLALVRTPSRSSPPELLHESDDDSDEDSMPPSPPAPDMQMSFSRNKKEAEAIQNAFDEEGFYLPSRSQVSAY